MQLVEKARVSEDMRGKAAIARVAHEFRRIAQILAISGAIAARATNAAEPPDADTLSYSKLAHADAYAINNSHDLVPGRDWRASGGQLTVDDVKVRPADAARADANANLARLRRGVGHFLNAQRRARPSKAHGEHCLQPSLPDVVQG